MAPDIAIQQVSALCSDTAGIAASAVGWLERNKELIGATKFPTLRRDFRRREMLARRYERASQRPLCVGVFGPSQVGKSYLVSALARKGTDPLIVMLDRERDFLKEINPEADQEATGLVTRFSVNPTTAPAGFPVHVRLLNQVEIIKILSNTYFLDFDATKENVPRETDIEAAFDEAASKTIERSSDGLTDVDIDDLRRYFAAQFSSRQTAKVLVETSYWSRLEALAPRLRIQDRIKLYSFLWGRIEEFTVVYRQLYAVLESLGFPEEAFCAIEALMPRETSIVNVKSLVGISDAGGETVKVRAPGGPDRDIRRAHLTAVVAELIVQIKEPAWDFFKHTDLLDFPGARSREMNEDVENYVKKPGAMAGLFRRGKVAYLFDRYCDESEISAMLLCLAPGNQDVRTLPQLVSTWLRETHGLSPEARKGKQTSLFVVLTKFDKRFEESKGREQSSSDERWTGALKDALTGFFASTADNWALEWTPGAPFTNVFWLRNPNFIAPGLMRYSPNRVELGIAEPERIEGFKREYLANEYVRRHFANPAKSWDEAFRLNDGGVSYLAELLAPVCRPELKREQIRSRIEDIRLEMVTALTDYYVSDDDSVEKDKRKAAARKAAMALYDNVRSQRFGHLLNAFQVSNEELQLLFRRLLATGEVHESPAPNVTAMFEQIGLIETEEKVEEEAGDKYVDLATAALQHWAERIQSLAQQAKTLEFLRAKPEPIEVVIKELLAGADRVGLRDSIADEIRAVAPAINQAATSMLQPAMAAAERIDAFVWKLNQDQVKLKEKAIVQNTREEVFKKRPPITGNIDLPENKSAFYQEFIRDWFASFIFLAEKNSEVKIHGKFSAEDATALRQIMTQLAAA